MQNTVVNAKSDADLLIAQTAVESAKISDTVVVGDDTDLLVLLCFHSDMTAHEMYFIPEPKTMSTKQRVWDIKSTKSVLGLDICQRLLFIHAILGCDTTSQPFGIGKGAALKLAIKSSYIAELTDEFSKEDLSKEDIRKLGEKHLLPYIRALRMKDWTAYDIGDFVKRSPRVRSLLSLRVCHQHQLHHNITV